MWLWETLVRMTFASFMCGLVLLLILLSLALSIVLRPRGRDIPTDLSRNDSAAGLSLMA